MNAHHSPSRRAGDALIVARAQRQVQTFFDELKNGTRNYRTVSSLNTQVAQEYRGRCILELLQNAHDALANAESDDPKRISFVLNTSPKPVLLIGNSSSPFRHEDFEGICELGQSPKDPNENVGNKGLGFRSVLEVSTCPEIWSTTPKGSDTSFVFRFDTSVSEQIARAARDLERQGLKARSPFDAERPLVDWSHEQLEQYRKRLSNADLDGADEARKYLSPYMLPLTFNVALPQVEKLLNEGHVTVIRLCLDGGRGGTWEEAVQSVKDQLQRLDAKSTIFLPHLETLVIDIDGERRVMERVIDSAAELPGCQRTQWHRLLVGQSGPTLDNHTTRQFQVWTRNVGGEDCPEQAERIRTAVEHLPNRWTEVRRATVGVAVEEAPMPEKGVFVIFLPTETTTGMGSHINAPFYGSLDRRHINFNDPYNELLMESVLDLCIDVAMWLISGEVECWRARAVIDVLSSTTTVDGWSLRIMDDILEQASKRGQALNNQALILCDDGWHLPGEARVMPDLRDDSPISIDHWREHAGFAVVSTELDGRLGAVKELLKALDGSQDPTNQEWQKTIERMATHIQDHSIDATWDDFLTSLVSILPANLRSEPRAGALDPLAVTRFLPTQDGRLLSASDSTKLFFPPMRGVEDVTEFAEEVPDTVKPLIAFLHRDIRTREEGPQGRNTKVQKFLDRRFTRTFEREELIRTILDTRPPLPVSHDGPEGARCSELFAWAMKLLGDEELESLLPLIKRLPVACHGGWFAMSDATFGVGWPGRLGDLVGSLAKELPEEAAKQLRKKALLSPDDPRWGIAVKNRGELFARAGVVDGLRLQPAPKVSFEMSGYGNHRLPSIPPINTPQKAWNRWCDAVRGEAKPYYTGWFEYELSQVRLLPEIHHLASLSSSGQEILSHLVLASLKHWHADWESVVIKKTSGNSWSTRVTSPLKFWLKTLPWLNDRSDVKQPLGRRWLVPEFLLRGQQERYSHLHPLSLELTRRLNSEPTPHDSLVRLGLNVYPTENDRTGPELLDALATAWAEGRIPAERFDILLGQVRDAWHHLDPDKGLPDKFLLRTGRRTFSTLDGSNLADAYLPDDRDRTRALQEHGKYILEMHPLDARHKANALSAATNIKRASRLEERFLIDGAPWAEAVDGTPLLDETRYAAWLPITLLAIAAHGGASPTGTTTETWRAAANRLRRAHVLECGAIVTQLVDGDQTVASSEPEAQWLPGNVLAMRHDVELSYEKLASAAQALLDRQDLLRDLRLVLGTLSGQENPTSDQVERALERSEIDAQAFADVRHQWTGNTSLLMDRIRPVLALLGITGGFDAVTLDHERLKEWLSLNLPQWPAQDILAAAQQSRNDYAMGLATWRALDDDIAQLPAWNEALASLGNRYEPVKNLHMDEQTQAHLEEAIPLLRSLARHIAVKTDTPKLFPKLETVHQNLKVNSDWSTLWWEVPFGVVIDNLCACYAEIPGVEHHIEVLKGAENVDDLRTRLQRCGIAIDFDPYETADTNKTRLEEVLRQVYDLRLSWVEFRIPAPIAPDPEPQAVIDPTAYLYCWSDTELLKRVLSLIDDAKFVKVCDGCASIDEIRKCLGIDQRIIDARREERARHQREAERKQRTFEVAGAPFEIGAMSYRELFERLDNLAEPEGPRVSQDMFTPLADIRSGSGNTGGGDKRHGKTSQQRPSAEHRELVGVVGEIHAYRFLRMEFGSDIVTRNAWVSEIRLKVLSPVAGEPNATSDGHGFDFRFRDRGKKWWHVEVKATAGDDPQFELGISEVEAATRLARKRGERWRILRVRNALSDRPEFDWLPNPFEDSSRKYFRLHRGGLRVSYTRKSKRA